MNRAVVRRSRRAAPRKLLHVLLADEHGACVLEEPNDVRVFSRDAFRKQCAPAGRLYARCINQVFQSDRDAMQWTTPLAGANLAFSRARLGQRTVVHDGDESVEYWIELLDASETGVREIYRRDLFPAQQFRGFRDT